MSSIIRLVLAAALALGGAKASERSPAHQVRWAADRSVLREASMSLARLKPERTVTWLRSRHRVASAALGADGRTVNILFRDGVRAAVLPSGAAATPAAGKRLLDTRHTDRDQSRSTGRALVLEPFATEEMGAHDGDPIAADLQSAGFQLDQLYDSAVTVAEMSKLSQYNVVYLHTHAGVNQVGGAVFSTGEPAGNDPQADALVQSQDLYIVQVAGIPGQYYGILIPYIQHAMGQFPQNSILYIDTCELLQSQPLWDALAAKGVGAFISWKFESAIRDESAAAHLFFDRMATGATVGAALQSVHAAGLDVSVQDGQDGYLGYQGDGYLTLHGRDAAAPTATVPVLSPTGTSTSAPAHVPPTATSIIATPTARPAEPALSVTLLHAFVRPGARQTVEITAHPGTSVAVSVKYPNGDSQRANLTADSLCAATYSFVQNASRITRTSRRASISVGIPGTPSSQPLMRTYEIGFGALDVMVHPRAVHPGGHVSIWVHVEKQSDIWVTIYDGSQSVLREKEHTDGSGWSNVRYQIESAKYSADSRTLRIVASTTPMSGAHSTQTTVRVL
ncbi:MAG TPA: hypothetical protein VF898_07425 [Chloroflexota bacterium]